MIKGSEQGPNTQLREEHLEITQDGEEVFAEFHRKYSALSVGARNQHTHHFRVI